MAPASRYVNYFFHIKKAPRLDIPYMLYSIASYCVWRGDRDLASPTLSMDIYGYVQFYKPKSRECLLNKWSFETEWTNTTIADKALATAPYDFGRMHVVQYGIERTGVPLSLEARQLLITRKNIFKPPKNKKKSSSYSSHLAYQVTFFIYLFIFPD